MRSLGLPAFFDYTASVRTRIHRFLLLLMMLILPLQAWASATMLGCAFSHQATAPSLVMADAGCHESEPDAPPAQHDCRHCAVCALASVLPIAASATPAIMPAPHRFIPHPAASFSGFVPDGPERPPRPFLA